MTHEEMARRLAGMECERDEARAALALSLYNREQLQKQFDELRQAQAAVGLTLFDAEKQMGYPRAVMRSSARRLRGAEGSVMLVMNGLDRLGAHGSPELLEEIRPVQAQLRALWTHTLELADLTMAEAGITP